MLCSKLNSDDLLKGISEGILAGMRVKITADSTCDLPGYLLEEYDIGITPLSIVKGDESYKDGLEITPKNIFDCVESNSGAFHTTAVNTHEYHEVFTGILKDYDAIVHINIGSEFSACNQNANIAASENDNICVVDSGNLSMGMGYLALEAGKMAKLGADPCEIVQWLEQMKDKAEMSFTIDTLKYLHKGGRCSALTAMGANILGLKPCIEVVDGTMQVGKKYRGTPVKIAEQYVTDKLAGRDDIDERGIFIVHTNDRPEAIQAIENTIDRLGSFKIKYEGIAGCTISTHCGPGTFGIMFFRK